MFDDKMYMQLLGIIDLAIKQAIINSENFENEFVSLFFHNVFFTFFLSITSFSKLGCLRSSYAYSINDIKGHVPPVLRHVLEILPSLGPPEHLSSMWLILLREFLHYLPRVDSVLPNEEGEIKQTSTGHHASKYVMQSYS